MTESEVKAVRFIENIKNHAMVTLDHIAKEEPNVSPLFYKGREEKANTILAMVEEVQQYREIGTVEELIRGKRYMNIAKHHGTIGQVIDECVAYEAIGTPEECRAAMAKQTAKKPDYEGDGYADGHIVYDTWICPCCGKHYEVDYDDYDYCPNCGQRLEV